MFQEGIDNFDVGILDPLNEHRSDYVWLRFKSCYPDIYDNVIDIKSTAFRNMFLVKTITDKLFIFDYDSGDILGLVGPMEYYDDVVKLCNNLPRGFYFVDSCGVNTLVLHNDIKESLTKNTIGQLILQIVNMNNIEEVNSNN